jgi:hypothetical protein
LKNRSSSQCHLISPLWCGEGGGENPNVILIRIVALSNSSRSMRHHFRILKIIGSIKF